MQTKFSSLRQFFPIFRNDSSCASRGNEIFLDNAATTQKPQQVIDRIAYYYACENASVHRGVYSRAEFATQLYEKSREKIAQFIGAHHDEIVFTRGATEGINFIASSWGRNNLLKDDEIIISELEHNANVLPWLYLEKTLGIKVRYIPLNEQLDIDYEAFQHLINNKTKLIAISHRANSIGVKVNINLIREKAQDHNIPFLLDVAQTIAHEKIDVSVIKPDFLVFSAHKMLGPTGIGALYISRAMQEITPPYQFGGGMISALDVSSITWLKAPHKYEAGTPAIAQALGFAEGIDFINNHINFEELEKYQTYLTRELISGLQNIRDIQILGPTYNLSGSPIISFHSSRFHSHDIAAYLDQFNISVRAGNQCAQLVYNKLRIPGSLRISTFFYNTIDEIYFLLSKLEKLLSI